MLKHLKHLQRYLIAARSLLPSPVYLLVAVYFAVAFFATRGSYDWRAFLLGLLGLAAWCVNATTLEKLGAFEIEQRRGLGDSEGSLVMGLLRAPDLQVVAVATAIMALTLVAGYGFLALGVMLASLALNYVYAEPQLAISKYPGASTLLPPIGFVGLPMLLGSLADGKVPSLLLLALVLVLYGQFALLLRASRRF